MEILKRSFLLLLGLVIFNTLVFSQSKVEISGGYGFPESLNLKVKYGNNFQIGLSQSIYLNYIDAPLAVEIYYHFAGTSGFPEQKPWYLLGGFGDLWRLKNVIYFYPKVGRSFNFSKGTGINIDAGIFLINPPSMHTLPSLNISLFFRL